MDEELDDASKLSPEGLGNSSEHTVLATLGTLCLMWVDERGELIVSED